MNRIISKLTLSIFTILAVIAISSQTGFALDPLVVQTIDITCSPFGVTPDTVAINAVDTIKFLMNTTTCDSIRITGDAPIGSFKLRDSDPDSFIFFTGKGTFTYDVKNLANTDSLANRVIYSGAPTPFLGTWGIIALLLLLAATAWFVLSRRKVRTTGSAA
jgi:hypothetical protein